MWQITSDGYIVHDPRDPSRVTGSPKLTLEVNTAGTATFTVYPDNPAAGNLLKLASSVEITEGTTVLFRGRIIDDVKTFYNARNITCEGALAYLNDSVIRPFKFPEDFVDDAAYQTAASNGNVIEYFLGWVISQHNAQVANNRKLTLGTVTVTDANNYITREQTDYSTAWDTVREKLFESGLGGYLIARYAAGVTYVDYLSTLTTNSVQDVQFAENLLDLENQFDATETYTVVLPLGADVDDGNGGEAPLTISSLADGAINADLVKDGDQIYSVSGVASYGRICAPTSETTWEEVTEAANLQTKAAAWLANNGVKMTQTLTVKAADLYWLGESLKMFQPYTLVNVYSDPHTLSAQFGLTAITYDLNDPGNTEITLGSTVRTLTDQSMEHARSAQTQIDKTIVQLNSLAQTVSSQATEIIQDAQQIILTALEDYVTTGDFTSYQSTVSSALSVMSDQIVMNFTTVTNQITATNDEVARVYNERIQYIRFENGDIILGEQGNELVLKISNDRISFVQDNLEVAYFSDQKLYVTNGEFLTSLNLGVFGFVPAQNGSLSFKKVK